MAHTLQIFVKFDSGDFIKICQEIQIWLKSGKNIGPLHEGLSTFCCCWLH